MTVVAPPWEQRPLAAERYQRLGAQTARDSEGGFLLASIVEAKAAMYDDLEHIARDDENEVPGWVKAANPAECRREFLPWAAQLYGVHVDPAQVAPQVSDSVVNTIRARVIDRPARKYGTGQSITAAVMAFMEPGAVAPLIKFNFDPGNPGDRSAGHITIVVRAEDVTDEDQMRRAIEEVAPAWLLLHITIADLHTWDSLVATYDSWDDLVADKASWDDAQEI